MRFAEGVRDPRKYATLSGFVRCAVEQYAREIRRRHVAAECCDRTNEDLSASAESDLSDYAERVAWVERGEL